MKSDETRRQVLSTLRQTDNPALSAADVVEQVDASEQTVRERLDVLVANDEVQTHQIGNATAYFIDASDLPPHEKPNHYCRRCGRAIGSGHDNGKIDYDRFFYDESLEPGVSTFAVLCRFCYSDFICWLHGDDGAMGSYRDVESWTVPDEQKSEFLDRPADEG